MDCVCCYRCNSASCRLFLFQISKINDSTQGHAMQIIQSTIYVEQVKWRVVMTVWHITGPTSLALGAHTSYHHPPAGGTWHFYIKLLASTTNNLIWFCIYLLSFLYLTFQIFSVGICYVHMKVMYLLYSNNQGRGSLCMPCPCLRPIEPSMAVAWQMTKMQETRLSMDVPWPSLGWGTFALHVEQLSTNQKRL